MATPSFHTLATYQTDPNWQANQTAQLGQILGLATAAFRKRQQDTQDQDLSFVQLFLKNAAADPELAAGPYGEQIKKQYGSKFPSIVPLVDSLANVGQRTTEMTTAHRKWLDAANSIHAENQERTALLDSLPDTMPSINGPVPNVFRDAAAQQVAAIQPDEVYKQAAAKLKPSDAYAAQAWAQLNKQAFPDLTMDPQGDARQRNSRFPADIQATMAAAGQTDPRKMEGDIRQLVHLAPLQGHLAETTQRTDEQIREMGARREDALAELEAKGKQEKALEGLRHSNRLAQEKQQHGFRLGELAAQGARQAAHDALAYGDAGSADVPLADQLSGWNDQTIKDYDARLKQATSGEGVASGGASAAKAAFLADNGSRPARIAPPQAKQIDTETAALSKWGIVDPADRSSSALQVLATTHALTARGIGTNSAISNSLDNLAAEKAVSRWMAKGELDQAHAPAAKALVLAKLAAARKAGTPRLKALQEALGVSGN